MSEGKTKNFDVITQMKQQTQKFPNKKALIFPEKQALSMNVTWNSITYKELDDYSGLLAGYLQQKGIKRGDRILVMIPVSLTLYLVVFALIRLGAVVVFVDPWMDMKKLSQSCTISKPNAFIGIFKANFLRLYSSSFRNIPIKMTINKLDSSVLKYLKRVKHTGKIPLRKNKYDKESVVFIRFTTGSTGRPKGVKRTYGYLSDLFAATSDFFPLTKEDIDVTTYPLNIFYDVLMGATAVIPFVSYGRASRTDPSLFIRQIQECRVTTASGSPFYWKKIIEYCKTNKITNDTLRFIFTGGGPVPLQLIDSFKEVFSAAQIYIVYGSTEVFPLSWINIEEIIDSKAEQTRNGSGICVGKPHPNLNVKIITPMNETNTRKKKNLNSVSLQQGKIGEIITTGPQVTTSYYGDHNEKIFAANKIIDTNDTIWHRTGDAGYLDSSGNIWLVGRKKNIYTVNGNKICPLMIEYVFDSLPEIEKSALLQNPANKKLILVLEPKNKQILKNKERKKTLTKQVLSLCDAKDFPITSIVFVRKIPLDPRHNTKIDYTKLKKSLQM